MADKKIGISLAFQADTAQARAQIQSLQSKLNELSKVSAQNIGLGDISGVQEAVTSVSKLSSVLKSATNSAGTLDLSKFTNGLKAANLDATKIASSLRSLGPEGAKAFAQLSQSVLTAEVPIKRVNKHISDFMDGLKRTAGWQIQSTMIHKFTGAIQHAYGYAQDLNESLTNIRIVTGKSTDEMAKFAKEANKAAKELSTTTTSYTDAALIFYQQGLDGDAVKQRTDTVIKMSNVTGQSAEEVSSYMTAIWNNFYDGSQSLEHYADVITALGAATASSSEEIAEGLEKFAAIGNTVGLSYEYATSALATVVAQTRQSADTVGTAFKTLFARIQDLEVGKTLDDGTTLGKYSQALASIGVNIKDASGQVKDMDAILDEMGNKWKTIDKNTQIAVAQAVAGTRQYSQLVALMDNYDTFKENLTTARASEGALQEQADIYEESWDAAQKRVRASLEGLYDGLINDKFFIKLNNDLAELIQTISKVVEAVGGFKTLLPAIGVILTKYFGKSMSAGLNNFKQSLIDTLATVPKIGKSFQSKTSDAKNEQTRNQFTSELSNLTSSKSIVGTIQADNIQRQAEAQQTLIDRQKTLAQQGIELNENEKAYAQQLLQVIDMLNKEAEATAKVARSKDNLTKQKTFKELGGQENYGKQFKTAKTQALIGKDVQSRFTEIENIPTGKAFEKLKTSMKSYLNDMKKMTNVNNDAFDEIIEKATDYKTLLNKIEEQTKKLESIATEKSNKLGNSGVVSPQEIEDASQGMEEYISDCGDAAAANVSAGNAAQAAGEQFNGLGIRTVSVADRFISAGQAAMALVTAINALQGLGDIWVDEDASAGEKILQTMMIMSMVIPNIVTAAKGLQTVFTLNTAAITADAAATEADTAEKEANAVATYAACLPLLVLVGVLTVLVGIFAALGIAEKKRIKNLEKAAEQSKRSADAQKAYTETLKKESDEVQNLSNAYNDLYAQFEKGELSYEQLKTKAYQLCMQYGEEGLALQALSGNYKMVGEAIDELNSKKAIQAADAAKDEAIRYKKAIEDQIKVTGDKEYNKNNNSITLKSKDKGLNTELKNLGVKFNSDYQIDLDSFVDALEKNGQKVQQVLSESDSAAGEQLRKYIDEASDSLTNLESAVADAAKYKLEAIGTQYKNQQISSMQDYNDTIARMAREALNAGVYNSMADAEEWANSYMSAIDKVANYSKKYTQSQKIVSDLIGNDFIANLDKIDKDIDKVRDFGSKYGNALDLTNSSFDRFGNAKDKWGSSTNRDRMQLLTKYRTDNYVYDRTVTEGASGGYTYYKHKDTGEEVKVRFGASLVSRDKDYYDAFSGQLEKEVNTERDLKEQKRKLEDNYNNAKKLITNQLTNSSAETLAFFTNNSYLLVDYIQTMAEGGQNAIEAASEKWSKALTYKANEAGAQYMASLIQSMNKEGRTLSFDELNTLSKDYGQSFNSESNFGLMNQSSQMISLLQQYSQAEEEMKANADEMRKAAQANLDTYKSMKSGDKSYKDLANEYKNALNEVNELVKKAAEKGMEDFTSSEIEALAAKVQTVGVENLTGDFKDLYDELVQLKGEKDAKSFIEKLGNTKVYYDNIKKLEAQISSAGEANLDYKTTLELLNNAEKSINKSLDDTQSAYKTLTNAALEYNSQGYMTMDTLQSLLSLNPKYINCLIDEGGQFSLNRDRLIEYTKAQLLNYEYEQALNAEAALTKALKGDEQALTELQTAALYGETDATISATDAKMKHNEELVKELKLKSLDTSLSQKERDKYAAAARNGEAYLKSTKKSITAIRATTANLVSNFDDIMGASKKSKKYFEDEFDRYWEFTKAIEAVENAMSNLEEQQDRLYGKELIDNLTKVNSLLAQQEANYKALAVAQEEEAEELRNTLSQYGAEFDENGALSNYATITSSMFSQYAGHEESENYKAFKKALDRYDALFYSEMVDTANNTAQASRKIMENNLKIWETDLQINLDLRQSQRDWNDFIHNLNADIKSATKDIGKEMAYNLSQIDTYNLVDGTIATDIQKIENINAEIDKLKNGGVSQFYGSLSEAENALAEANEQLRSDTLEVKSLFEATWESYLEGIDQAAEDLEKINQEYETLNEQLEHQIQLTNLLYGDAAYDKMAKIYEAQEKASLNQLDSLRKQSDFWLDQYNTATASDGEDSESAQKALEKYKESIQALNAEEENYIQILQNKYNNAIDSIVEKAKSDIQESRTNWDDINKQNEGIYDDTERLYQLNSMQTKWNKLISNTTGLKNQQALAKVMQEQMSYLEEKTRLSEYDIGLAEKELSIAQAQIALEEAQNSKNSMKMTRGADGNWSYQYVADDAAVEDKQQALLDTINDKYNYIKDANRKALEDIMSYEEEYLTRYSEIMKNTTLSQEEKEAKTAQLYQTYYGETGILTNAYRQAQLTESQLNVATYEQLTALYQADETNYENMTANEKILVDAFKNGQIQNEKDIMDYGKQCNDESLDYWNSTAKQMSDAWNADDGESIKSQVQQSMEECEGFLNNYNEAIKLGCEAAKEDFAKIENAVININTAIDNLNNATDNYLATASQNLEIYRSNLDSATAAWDELKSKVGENITTMREYEIAANKAIAKAQAATAAAKKVNSGIPITDKTENEISKNYGWVVTELGNTVESETTGYTLAEAKQKASDVLDQEERYGTPSDALKRYYIEPNGKWIPFASGGYTGEWGDPTNSNGKLAMLHQKELVLNADDTENILKTVSFVRDLAASIGSTLMSNLFGIAASMSGITPASISNITTNNGDSSNNVYNITAEFPNANNVDDIREAILNLPNYVSQFINR